LIKVMYPLIPNNVAGNMLRIRVKEYHQTRKGLKKNPNFEWFKRFENRIKDFEVKEIKEI